LKDYGRTVYITSIRILEFSEKLFQYARFLTRDTVEAEDLLQDTLFRAFNNQQKFQTGTNLYVWLIVIMKNLFFNVCKKNKLREERIAELQWFQSDLWVRNESEVNFFMGDFHHALQSIRAIYSEPFILSLEGFKYHEIGNILSVPEGTVKTRIHSCRMKLKLLMANYRQQGARHKDATSEDSVPR